MSNDTSGSAVTSGLLGELGFLCYLKEPRHLRQ